MCVCSCLLLSLFLCAGPGMSVWSARVGCCETAAKFYWWMLFQKPDQIEVGEDGFKQWDGKTSLKTASDHRWPSSAGNSHLLTLHTFSHFNLAYMSVIDNLLQYIWEKYSKRLFEHFYILRVFILNLLFCVVAPQWSRLWTWRQWPTLFKAGLRTQWSLPVPMVLISHPQLMWATATSGRTSWSWKASCSITTRRLFMSIKPFCLLLRNHVYLGASLLWITWSLYVYEEPGRVRDKGFSWKGHSGSPHQSLSRLLVLCVPSTGVKPSDKTWSE